MNQTSFLREIRNWRQTTELKIQKDVIRQKEQRRIQLKRRDELGCSGLVSCSCSTSVTYGAIFIQIRGQPMKEYRTRSTTNRT